MAGSWLTTHVLAVCLLAWCTLAADEAIAPVSTWGVQDQIAIVGRLFELKLPVPTVEGATIVLRVSHHFCSPPPRILVGGRPPVKK